MAIEDDRRSEVTRARSLADGPSPHQHRLGFFPDQRISALLLALLDWFIPSPPAQQSRSILRRARLTVSIGLFSGIGVLCTLIVAPDEPDSIPIRLMSYSFAAMLLGAPLMLKWGVPARRVQNGFIALMFGYAMTLAASTGGADSGGLVVAIFLPLFAVLLSGPRDGLIWTGIACVGLACIAIAVEAGYEAPIRPHLADVAIWNLWAGIAGMVAALGVAQTHEWLQGSILQSLEKARQSERLAHADRLNAEEALRGKLELLVEERTNELDKSRNQLRRADRLASIGTLAAGVAHQINNPVGSILLGSEFALDTEDPEERETIYREALESNLKNAKRCGDIVQNLLHFSRIGGSEKTVFDLNTAAQEAVVSLNGPGTQFEWALCDRPLRIQASTIEIEQVIVNLVSNALQSGMDASGKVEISTECEGDDAVLHVRDHGRGITPDDLERVFDPFFTTRMTAGGTGLGLSVVHGIVEEHGGRIEFESHVGSGTRATVRLPLIA